MSSLDVTYSVSAVVEAAAVSHTHSFDYFWFGFELASLIVLVLILAMLQQMTQLPFRVVPCCNEN